MKNVPSTIDDAKVVLTLEMTNSVDLTGFTKHIVNGEDMINPVGLAICRYNEEQGFYLFYCNSNWEVLNDTFHESEELAVEQAELEFRGTKNLWNRK